MWSQLYPVLGHRGTGDGEPVICCTEPQRHLGRGASHILYWATELVGTGSQLYPVLGHGGTGVTPNFSTEMYKLS